MEKQQLVSPHDNAPAHRSVLVKDFFAKNNVTKVVLTWLQLISPVPLTEINIEGTALL
jgi:hypothetical protein